MYTHTLAACARQEQQNFTHSIQKLQHPGRLVPRNAASPANPPHSAAPKRRGNSKGTLLNTTRERGALETTSTKGAMRGRAWKRAEAPSSLPRRRATKT